MLRNLGKRLFSPIKNCIAMSKGTQLLRETILELVVTGDGKTMNDASASIFKQIHKQIYKELDYPIIQMETQEVYFDDVQKETKNKLLLPKKDDVKYIVKARVVLKVKYLEIQKEKE
ncbi:DUF4312 domain-containing protein [Erysipelothrix tonsillarum]